MRGFRFAVLAAMIMMCMNSGLRAQSRIPWTQDLTLARQMARRQQRLLLLHFWSNSCPPCLRLERYVFNQPEVIRAISSNYVPVKINATDNPQLAAQFRVNRWPTDIIATVDGQEVYRGVSQQDPNRYIAILDQVAANTRVGLPIEGSASTPIAKTPTPNSGPCGPGYPAPGQMAASPSEPVMAWSEPSYTPRRSPARSAMPPAAPQAVTNRYAGAPAMAPPPRSAPIAPAYGGQYVPPAAASPRGANAGLVAQRSESPNQQAMPPLQSRATAPPQPPAAASNPYASGNAAGAQSPANALAAGPSAPPAGSLQVGPTQAPLGLDGYCPVTLVEQQKWVKGDPRWGAVHEGRTYLFTGPEQQQRFLAQFDKYAPVLSGYDPVQFVEKGSLVNGKRAHGVFYRDQIYLFVDESSLQQFWSAPERYALAVLTARNQRREQGTTHR